MAETTQTSQKTEVDDALLSVKGRYRSLILSIVLFLSLIGALLVFTFYTSSILQQNTALINSANKVAYATQSVIKDLFDMQNSYGEDVSSPHVRTVLARLKTNSSEINEMLNVLENGGSFTDSEGNQITVPQVTDSNIVPVLSETKKQWLELKPKVDDYLKVASNIQVDSSTALAVAGEQAKTSSLAMSNSLFTLTQEVFESAERQAATIRLVQLIGVVAILAYFAVFIFFFVKRLRETDNQVEEARRETQEIMENVTTGLFLLDQDLKIGHQFSKALTGIVGTERLAGENLTNVLRGRVSDQDLTTTKQFIEQLYNPRVKEKLVEDLNPLKKVLVHDANSSIGSSRYLDFKFSRVYENKDIARILVNVSDVSEAVRLEQRLEKERQQTDMQIEMLTTVLNVEPSMIQSFIVNTKQYIEKMNNILKNPGSTQSELEGKITAIYREMHSLKGESSALKLQSFTALASDAENTLNELRQQPRLTGNDFLPLTVQLDGLLNLSNMIESLGQRIGTTFLTTDYSPLQNLKGDDDEEAFSRSHLEMMEQTEESKTATNAPVDENAIAKDVGTTVVEPAVETVESVAEPVTAPVERADIAPAVATVAPVVAQSIEKVGVDQAVQLQRYTQFVHDVAERQRKRVELDSSGFHADALPSHLESAVREITMQLLKNAIVHGLEKNIVRIAEGKPAKGTVILVQEQIGQQLSLIVADDGQGINYDKIRTKLVELEKYDAEEVVNLSEEKLISHLFDSGFSTKDDVDEDAGRGVGMDIIKARVDELNGEISVHSEQGKYTRFEITIPV